jgi:hypothetical protein
MFSRLTVAITIMVLLIAGTALTWAFVVLQSLPKLGTHLVR